MIMEQNIRSGYVPNVMHAKSLWHTTYGQDMSPMAYMLNTYGTQHTLRGCPHWHACCIASTLGWESPMLVLLVGAVAGPQQQICSDRLDEGRPSHTAELKRGAGFKGTQR